jgi:anti-sigma factor ChrR (cupin superfamily)
MHRIRPFKVNAREHDAWFRAQVRKALNDPRPGVHHKAALDQTRAIIDQIASRKIQA